MRHLRRCTFAIMLAASAAVVSPAASQQGPVNGMRPADLRTHAITNATVVTAPGETIDNATILIRNGVILAVGSDVDVPDHAWVWPGDGLTVYPGLIDAALVIDADRSNNSAGAHWNSRVRPELNMVDQPVPAASVRKDMRELGFTIAAVYPSSGVFRGSGAVLALAEDDEHVLAYRNRVAMAAGFDFGGRWSDASYPGSLMGAIALIRQTLYDAQWHAEARRVYEENPTGNEPPMRADALVALSDVIAGRQQVLFDTSDEINALRAAKIAAEFNLDMALLGSGMEFRRLDRIVELDMPIIVPLNFPERPNVSTLAMADRVSLRDLLTWEQAPTNARRLHEAGATVALTTHRLRRKNTFPAALRNAIKHGLDEDAALAALTTTPAKLLGIADVAGTIAPGKAANLVVVEGSLFDADSKIRDTWVNGRRHEISRDPDITFEGAGTLTTSDGLELAVELNTERSRFSIELVNGKKEQAKNVTVQRDHVSAVVDGRPFDSVGYVRLSGVISGGVVTGSGEMPDGRAFNFTIEPADEDADGDDDQGDDPVDEQDAENGEGAGVAGTWALSVQIEGMPDAIPVQLVLTEEEDGTITGVSTAMDFDTPILDAQYNKNTGELTYRMETPGGMTEVLAQIDGDHFSGTFTVAEMQGSFSGSRIIEGEQEEADTFVMPGDDLVYPLGAFGLAQPPQQQRVLVRGATIWTAGPAGIIEEGDLFVENGAITYVGPTRSWAWGSGEQPTIINARGKHITPGLIDCHSHTGISNGVNEWTQVNTAEVRIADVINPDDVNWYRQLAGGLTAANQLHGSANPIGGQNSVVKLKWAGAGGADDMLVEDAIAGIKFALGENVVRTQSRYPNTRMGVETILRDAFTAAREYEQRRVNNNGSMPVRRDLELDALVEILNGERLVHCHSYRQDEILMLIRVAEDFGFTIGTFQHVLEGYKVAEAIADHQRDTHGAGASAFSDWWGYKVEVQDAIPYAGTLMHEVGINVSFNSDSGDVARRMNTEASKAVRYGGMSPHEALKFVTLNPAMQLRIDHRTGSLETGKDADFVIWSDNPLSTYARAEQTWIEGAKYFDLDLDRELREHVQRERQRLIQRVLVSQHGEAPEQTPEAEDDSETEAEPARSRGRLMQRLIDNRRAVMAEQYRLGRDPEEIRPGECGCNDWWYGLR